MFLVLTILASTILVATYGRSGTDVDGRRLVERTVQLSRRGMAGNNNPFKTIVTHSNGVITAKIGHIATGGSPATRTRIDTVHTTYRGLGAFSLDNYRVCASYRPYPVYLNTVC